MSLGATVVKNVPIYRAGGLRFKLVEFTGDGSYSAGGYAYAATDASLKWNAIYDVMFDGAMGSEGSGGTALVPKWDRANTKIKLWKGNGAAALTESAAGDPSGLKCCGLVIGA